MASKVLIEQDREFWSVAFNRDGNLLAAASSDQTVKLWDLKTPDAAPLLLRGHEREVRSVAFSPDGNTLASAGSDKTVRLWDMKRPRVVPRVLRGHMDTVWSVAFRLDGSTIASAGSDKTILLRMARTSRLAELVCERVLRNMTFHEWQSFVGGAFPYERTCENLPVHASVLEAADNRARAQDLEGAMALFERVAALDPALSITPDKRAKTVAADALAERGRVAARTGDADAAVQWLQQVKALVPELELRESDLEQLAVKSLVDRGQLAAQAGKIDEALADYDKAREIGLTLKITAKDWDSLCWYGSLWGYASNANVMAACERAVDLEPKHGVWRHSRGVARGITGDFQGVTEDLRYFVAWERQRQKQRQIGLVQETWIEALEGGQNPFDAKTLETLRR